MLNRAVIVLVCMCCFWGGSVSAAAAAALEQLFGIAQTYQHKGRYLEALSFYRDIELNADNATVPQTLFKNMGDIYFEFLESYDQAQSYYLKQLQTFPLCSCAPFIRHRIARIRYMKGEREQSLHDYQTLVSRYPEYCKKNSIASEMKRLEKGERLFFAPAVITDRIFPQQIRVLLTDHDDSAMVCAKDGLIFSTTVKGLFLESTAGATISCRVANEGIHISTDGLVHEPLLIQAKGGGCIEINNKPYRGTLRISLQDGRLLLVNILPLEDYLYGVVSKEVPASWPTAVLQAQAVAARTYALYMAAKRETEPYDLYATVAAQVYGGKDSEQESSRAAVHTTKGQVISYHNRLAYPLYHANSGGMTASAAEIWGWPAPYLISQRDEFSIDRKGFQWEYSLSKNDLQENFKQFGIALSVPKTLVPLERDMSGRIKSLRIEADGQTLILSGNTFRLIAGPGKCKSSRFSVNPAGQTFTVAGSGFGHGAGMSQWGACEMARKGYGYEQILQFYYPGTNIVRVNDTRTEQLH